MKLNLTCNHILVEALLMRVLPVRWVHELHTSFDIPKIRLYNAVSILVRQKKIVINKDITGERLIFLTQKGYDCATKFVQINYTFRTWNKDASRIGTIFQEHHYMLFRFFLAYFNTNNAQEVRTDYDKYCQFQYAYDSNLLIKPDGIIFPLNDTNLPICIEADTGSMQQRLLFEKILRYLIFAHRNFAGYDIKILKVFISFKTKERINSIFNDKDNPYNLYRFFASNIYRFELGYGMDYLYVDQVAELLESRRIIFYIGFYNDPLEKFKEPPFLQAINRFRMN